MSIALSDPTSFRLDRSACGGTHWHNNPPGRSAAAHRNCSRTDPKRSTHAVDAMNSSTASTAGIPWAPAKRCAEEIQNALRALGVQPKTWSDARRGVSSAP